jgi:signal transduction histidine kinase/ActR/RegA family two-component response regulator
MRRFLRNLGLRTKFLLSMVLVTTFVTGLAFLVIRQMVQDQARRELTASANKSLVMFEILQHQRQATMSRKADLLATSAYLTDDDVNSFLDSTNNPFDTSGNDLMALADANGKIVALHSAQFDMSAQAIEPLLQSSLATKRTSDWWFNQGRLFQVELQPIHALGTDAQGSSPTVIVAQELDEHAIRDLAHLLSSEVALRFKDHLVTSTFDSYREAELAAQLAAHSSRDEITLGNERYFASSVQLTPGQSAGATLIVLRSDAETMAFLRRLNHLLLQIGLFAVLAGAILAYLISDTITQPLASLVQGVKALERGDYDYRLQVQGGDEVAKVADAFDRMRHTLQRNESERQQLEDQLRQSQKMEALGRLAGGVAHDFNNLLTIIKGHSELLLERLNVSDSIYKNGEQIHKAADRASSLTRQLLVFSRRQVLQPKVLDLNLLVTEMDKLLRRLIREDVEFVFLPGDDLKSVKADPGQIEQVLMNLTVNACDAMPQGGKLTIATRNVTVDSAYAQTRPGLIPGSYVLLSTTDTGCGMDAKTQARIFEPFFTTKEAGKGTGLGLSTVYGIVKQSSGFIWVQSAPGKGSCFEVYLPQVQEQATIAEKAVSLTSAPDALTVLVVEDDDSVRELAARFLDTAGYRAIMAKDGVEALQFANELGSAIGALVTDVVMPRMRGTELATRLANLLPDVKVIFMSGYLEHVEESQQAIDDSLFLEKPFTRESLIHKVNEAFRSADLAHLKR